MDVGVLILNAGTAVMGPFKDVTDKEVERTVTVNALQPIYLLKTMVPQLLIRHEDTRPLALNQPSLSSPPASVPVQSPGPCPTALPNPSALS